MFVADPRVCLEQLSRHATCEKSLTFTAQGSTLDVRVWRLKSIPAL